MKKLRPRKVQAEAVWAYMKHRGASQMAASTAVGSLTRSGCVKFIDMLTPELDSHGVSREEAEAAVGDWYVRQILGGDLESLGWDFESSFQRKS